MRCCKSDTLSICSSRMKFLTRRRSEDRAYFRKSKPYCRKIPSSKRSISRSSVDKACCVANILQVLRPSPGAPASIKLSRRPLPEGEGPLPLGAAGAWGSTLHAALPLLHHKIEISVKNIVRPIAVALAQYGLAAAEQCGTDGAAGERT